MEWLIVLSDRQAADWVLANERMAFRSNANATRLDPGDSVAIYLAQKAWSTTERQQPRIVALGRVTTGVATEPVEVAGQTYDCSCGLALAAKLPLHEGLPFRPLIDQLSFIKNKRAWHANVQRVLAPLGEGDFAVIRAAFLALPTGSTSPPG